MRQKPRFLGQEPNIPKGLVVRIEVKINGKGPRTTWYFDLSRQLQQVRKFCSENNIVIAKEFEMPARDVPKDDFVSDLSEFTNWFAENDGGTATLH